MKFSWKRTLVLLFALLMTLSLAACTKSSPAPTVAPSAAATSSATPADMSLAKYDPPITITAIKVVPDTVNYFPKGQDINNNMWVDLMRDQLGITIKYDWTASTQQQYDDKLNVNIAAGNLPDITEVNKNQLARLVKTDLINKDLGAVLDQYSSPLLKQFNTQEGPANLASATFDGKLAALPQSSGSMDYTNIMWLRQDWLDSLGMKAPTTIAEFETLADAFMKDPGKTGATDYVAIALSKELFNCGEADLVGIANMFHAYPTIWVKDPTTGKLVYGSYQPAMKEALKKAQEWYAKGWLDKEFAVKDNTKESELIANEKTGIEFGQQWNPLWPLQFSKDNNAKADWTPYPLPSVDGTPATPQVQLGVSSYYVANAKFANPEAIVKIQNIYAKMLRSASVDEFKYIMYDDAAGVHFQPFFYCLCRTWPADKNLVNWKAVTDAFSTNDNSKLNPEQLSIYNTMVKYKGGNNSSWGMSDLNKPNGSYKVIGDYVDNNALVMNAYFGADTPTMSTKKSALDKLEIETFTKIIMGDPIDNFDKFVTSAMSLGGSDIEKEVNDWYSAQPK